jgi:hypothetical protein
VTIRENGCERSLCACSVSGGVESRRMVSSGMLNRVAIVRTDVSEELSASFIRVTEISEPGTTLVTASVVPRGYISQKTTFFIVASEKISNLTC